MNGQNVEMEMLLKLTMYKVDDDEKLVDRPR